MTTHRKNETALSLLRRLDELKAEQEALAAEREDIQSILISREDELSGQTYTDDDGWSYTATVVRADNPPKIDPEGLKEAIGTRLWNKITVAKIDTKALEAEVVRGAIDVATVADHSTVTAKKPYVRLTVKSGERR